MENFADDIVFDVQKKISDGADEIVGNALNNIAKYLPTDSEKENFLARIQEIKAEGIEAALNGEDYRQYLNRGAYETSVFLANHYAKEILERAKNKFFRLYKKCRGEVLKVSAAGNLLKSSKINLRISAENILKSTSKIKVKSGAKISATVFTEK